PGASSFVSSRGTSSVGLMLTLLLRPATPGAQARPTPRSPNVSARERTGFGGCLLDPIVMGLVSSATAGEPGSDGGSSGRVPDRRLEAWVIVCPRCSKENQDHYKFCLGCGAELPRTAAHQPKSFTAPTPPAGMPSNMSGGGASGRSFAAPVAPDAPTQVALSP